MSDARTVVLVGHCNPDMFMLRTAVGRALPGATIETANDTEAAHAHAHAGAVWLVNRELDGQFETGSGVELIGSFAGADDPPAMLLISNLTEAQQHAEAAGARPGFGKAQLYHARTAELLRQAAGVQGSA